jgi:hypothetical protein
MDILWGSISYRNVSLVWRYGEGIDALGDLIDMAVDAKVIEKHGAYYAFEDNNIGQGRERTREALKIDEELRNRIAEKTWSIKTNEAQKQRVTQTEQAA